ncbi:MAG: hypothetical protein ACD_69C00289G0001, partial [uncultured bacterium]
MLDPRVKHEDDSIGKDPRISASKKWVRPQKGS